MEIQKFDTIGGYLEYNRILKNNKDLLGITKDLMKKINIYGFLPEDFYTAMFDYWLFNYYLINLILLILYIIFLKKSMSV